MGLFLFPLSFGGANGFMAQLTASASAAGERAAALIQPGPSPSRPCPAVGSEPSRLAAPAWGHLEARGAGRGHLPPPDGTWDVWGRAWAQQKCALHRGPPSPPRRPASEPGLGPRACPEIWAHSVTPVWGPQGSARLQRGRRKPPGPTPASRGLQRARPRVAGVRTSAEPLGTPSPEGAAGTAQPHPGPVERPPRWHPGRVVSGAPWQCLGPVPDW